MPRVLIAAFVGVVAVVAAVVLYGGVGMWLAERELPPGSELAVGFDPVALFREPWAWVAAGVVFVVGSALTYRRVK